MYSRCDLKKKKNMKASRPSASAAASRYKNFRGTGLGLSVVHDMCRTLWDGDVWFETELGVGSSFYFTTPYEPCPPGTQLPTTSHAVSFMLSSAATRRNSRSNGSASNGAAPSNSTSLDGLSTSIHRDTFSFLLTFRLLC